MTVISRQFSKDILLSTLFVLVVLMALFAFFDLIGHMDEVASNEYDLAKAFLLTGLTLPSRAYEVAPLAVLLASVYTMSRWASTSEFTVLRAAGLSPLRLAATLILPGILLVALTFAVGEGLAPGAQRWASEIKSSGAALTARGYDSGAWIRDTARGSSGEELVRYINIRSVSASNRQATGAWRIFEFDAKGRLDRVLTADAGLFRQGEGWTLSHVRALRYPASGRDDAAQEPVVEEVLETASYSATSITPEILGVMTTKPDRMAMADLSQYIDHLETVNQSSEHFVAVFWSKVLYPFGVLVMLALSMPFAYMNARSGGVAIKVFAGVLIGIAFYALNNLFAYLSGFSSASPWLMAAAPSLMMFAGSAAALWWVEKR